MSTYISFYLKTNRIHICVKALRQINSPKRICFMIDESGSSLLVAPYYKRDLKSHKVPDKVYSSGASWEINSYQLCRIISQNHGWEEGCSYRIPGFIDEKNQVAVFKLGEAVKI